MPPVAGFFWHPMVFSTCCGYPPIPARAIHSPSPLLEFPSLTYLHVGVGVGVGVGCGGGRGGVRACVLVGSGLVGGFGGLSVAGPLCLKQLVSLPNSPMAEQARVLVLQRKVLPCLGFRV